MVTTDEDVLVTDVQRQPLLRAVLAAPPAALLLASLAPLAVSPFAWGAADIIDLPAWMPPAICVVAALGGIVVGGYALREVLRRTRGDFDVFGLQLVFGLIMFTVGVVAQLTFALELPDTDTYRAALNEEGELEVSRDVFFVASTGVGLITFAWVWAGSYIYISAFENRQPNRLSRRAPDEVDGVGELLRERGRS